MAAIEFCSFIRLSLCCPLFCVLVVCELWLLLLTKDKADGMVGHPAARLQVWRNRLTRTVHIYIYRQKLYIIFTKLFN